MDTTTQNTKQELRHGSERKSPREGAELDVQQAWTDASHALEKLYTQASIKLQEQVHERPYAALATAAGIGFVLGGGLRSVTGRVLLRTAAQFVLPGVLATLRGAEE